MSSRLHLVLCGRDYRVGVAPGFVGCWVLSGNLWGPCPNCLTGMGVSFSVQGRVL